MLKTKYIWVYFKRLSHSAAWNHDHEFTAYARGEHRDCQIGKVRWSQRSRCYCFFPDGDGGYVAEWLEEIAQFLSRILS